MSDFIMTMDERSDYSSDSDDQDAGFSFDFNVRSEFIPGLIWLRFVQFTAILLLFAAPRTVCRPSFRALHVQRFFASNWLSVPVILASRTDLSIFNSRMTVWSEH